MVILCYHSIKRGDLMTFQQLRYLLEVYKTGSIAKAAANLFVTRPGVSLCINTLESELGYPIFIRTPKGLQPTPQGERALEYASRIFENYRMMTDMQPERRVVRIATVSYGPVRDATLQLLREYQHQKDTTLHFPSGGNLAQIKRLSLFELDVAILSPFTRDCQQIQEQLTAKALHCKKLARIPLMICIGKGHRLYDKPDLCVADFADETLLDTPSFAFSRQSWIQDYIPLNTSTLAVSDHFAVDAVAQGIGYSIRRLPTKRLRERQGLRCIPVDGLTVDLLCVTNPAHTLPPEAHRFLTLLDEAMVNYRDEFV